MASDVSYSQYVGLLVPDPQLCTPDTIWSSESAYTQAGPVPGVPTPGQDGQAMLLSSHGEQAAGSVLQAQVVEGGVPGTARLVWRRGGDTAYRGQDSPTACTGYEVLQTGSASIEYGQPSLVSVGGQLICAYTRLTVATALHDIRVQTYDGTTWSSAITVKTIETNAITPYDLRPTLVVMPDDAVHLYFWLATADSDLANIACYRSTDLGSTWALISRAVLPADIPTDPSPSAISEGYTPGYLAAAQLNGQLMLLMDLYDNYSSATHTDTIRQYASVDGGSHFDLVYASATDETRVSPSVIAWEGAFHVAYIYDSTERLYVGRVGAAHYSIEHAGRDINDAADLPATRVFAKFGSTPDESETKHQPPRLFASGTALYVIGTYYIGAANTGLLCYSTTDGVSWAELGSSATDPTYGSLWTGSHFPRDYAPLWYQGHMVLASAWETSGTVDPTLTILHFGGWSTITLPPTQAVGTDETALTWASKWIGRAAPTVQNWTLSGAGSGAAQTSGAYRLTTAVATRTYRQTFTVAVDSGVVVRARMAPITIGGSGQVYLKIELDDGASRYELRINFNAGALALINVPSGATLDTETVVYTGGVEILVAFAGTKGAGGTEGHASIWYRLDSDHSDREWTHWVTTTGLTSTVSSAVVGAVEWGHGIGSSSVSDWYEVFHVASNGTRQYAGWTDSDGEGLFSGQDNPDGLLAPRIGSARLYLADGVSVSSSGGASFRGDSWTISTRYRYPLESIFPSVAPSPRQGWRSLDDADEETIALRYGDGSQDTFADSDLLGIGLFGINFAEFTVHGYDNGTGWTHLLDGDARVASGLAWEQKGTSIRADDASDPMVFLHRAELAGATFDADGDLYRIQTNGAGRWDLQGSGQVCTIRVPNAAGSAIGSAGAIWSRDVVALIYLRGRVFSAYKITIPIQPTVDGDHRIGSMVIGPVIPFALPPSWGGSTTTEGGAELETVPDRSRRSAVLGPPRRIFEIAWTDGVDQTAVERTTPDWIQAQDHADAEPVGSVGDEGYLLEGVIRDLDGAHTPLVFVRRIPYDGDGPLDGVSLVRRADHALVRMTSPIRVENIQGDEEVDEVVRIASVTLEEEV